MTTYLKTLKILFLISIFTLQVACGGGGSGGGGSSNNQVQTINSSSVSFEKSTITLKSKIEYYSSEQINFTINNVPDDGLYVALLKKPYQPGTSPELFSDSKSISSASLSDISPTEGALFLNYFPGTEIGRGTFTDTMYAYFCIDEICSKQIQGSPTLITSNYIVDPKGSVSTQANSIELAVNKFEYDYLETNEDNFEIDIIESNSNDLVVNTNNSNNGINILTTEKLSANKLKTSFVYAPPAYGWANAGKNAGDITIDICHDNACNLPLLGSPIVVNTNYNIELGSPLGPNYNINPIERKLFAGQVIESGFSKNLNAIVYASSNPNSVTVYDLNTETEISFPLTLKPTSIDIDNLSNNIVIGHDKKITYINFDQNDPSNSSTSIFDVEARVIDISTFENIAYYSVKNGFGKVLDLITGSISNPPIVLTDFEKFKFNNNNKSILVAGYSSIDNWGINPFTNIASSANQNEIVPTTNQHNLDICEDLWISNNNKLVYTACGNVFDETDIYTSNHINIYNPLMTYKGFLKTKSEINPEASEQRGPYFIKSLTDNTPSNSIAYIERERYCYDNIFQINITLNRPCRPFLNITNLDNFTTNTSELEFPLFWKEDKPYVDSPEALYYESSGNYIYILTNLIGNNENISSIIKISN